jgi:hypothetical protein
MRGRLPLRPFLRAAAAFAREDFRPPTTDRLLTRGMAPDKFEVDTF